MPRADRRADVSPGPAAARRPGPGTVWLGTGHDTGRYPAGSSQPEWTAIMCTHDSSCPAADPIDWRAARTITEHPLPHRTRQR